MVSRVYLGRALDAQRVARLRRGESRYAARRCVIPSVYVALAIGAPQQRAWFRKWWGGSADADRKART